MPMMRDDGRIHLPAQFMGDFTDGWWWEFPRLQFQDSRHLQVQLLDIDTKRKVAEATPYRLSNGDLAVWIWLSDEVEEEATLKIILADQQKQLIYSVCLQPERVLYREPLGLQ